MLKGGNQCLSGETHLALSDNAVTEPPDTYLLEQHFPATAVSCCELINNLRSHSDTLDNLKDDFIRHYLFYLNSQRFNEAETVLLEYARMRNRDGALGELIPDLMHFYRKRPGKRGAEVATEMHKMLNSATDDQYWALYRQCSVICYQSDVPQAVCSLSRTPVAEMADRDFQLWKSTQQRIYSDFSDRNSSRFDYLSACVKWLVVSTLHQRNPVSTDCLTAILQLARLYKPTLPKKWNTEVLSYSHFELMISWVREVSEPAIARVVSVIFHPGFIWTAGAATLESLTQIIEASEHFQNRKTLIAHIGLAKIILHHFPQQRESAKSLVLTAIFLNRNRREMHWSQPYLDAAEVCRSMKDFACCEMVMLKGRCRCLSERGQKRVNIREIRKVYRKHS